MASLRLTGVTSELTKAQQFLAQWWGDQHLSDVERFPFDLALEELFINVASYGHDETGAPCRVELALIQSDVASEGEKDILMTKMMIVLPEKGAEVRQDLVKNIQTTKMMTIVIESVTNQIEKVVVGNATRIMKAVVRLIRQELGRIVEDVNEKDIESVG